MGVHDLEARFDAITVRDGTIGQAAVEATRKVAREINDQVNGEPYQLVAFIQGLESAAHTAATYLDFTADEQPGIPESDPPPAGTDYDGLSLGDLKAEIERRNEGRPEKKRLHVSGSKAELVARLQLDDQS